MKLTNNYVAFAIKSRELTETGEMWKKYGNDSIRICGRVELGRGERDGKGWNDKDRLRVR